MKIYIVQKGDTLYEIAQKHGQSLAFLKEMNPKINNPEHLTPGMKIKIPTPSSKPVRKEGLAKQIPLKKFNSKAMPVNEFLSKKKNIVKEESVKKEVKKVEKKKKLPKEKPVANKELKEKEMNLELNKNNTGNEPKAKHEANEPKAKHEANEPKAKHEANEPKAKHEANEPKAKHEANEPKANHEANESKVNVPINEPIHKIVNSNKLAPLQPLNDKEWGIESNQEAKGKKQINNEIPFMEELYPNLMGPAKEKNNKHKQISAEKYENKKVPFQVPLQHTANHNHKSQNIPIYQSHESYKKNPTNSNSGKNHYNSYGKQSGYQMDPHVASGPQTYGEGSQEEISAQLSQGWSTGTYLSASHGPSLPQDGTYQGALGPYGGAYLPYGLTPPSDVSFPPYDDTSYGAPEGYGSMPMPYGGMPSGPPYGSPGPMPMPYGGAPEEHHGSMPMPYGGGMPPGPPYASPGQMPMPYGGAPEEHGSMPMPYGGMPPGPPYGSRGQMSMPYGGAPFGHSNRPLLQGGHSEIKGVTSQRPSPFQYGSMQSTYQETTRPYEGVPMPYGLTPPPYVGFSRNPQVANQNNHEQDNSYNKGSDTNDNRKQQDQE